MKNFMIYGLSILISASSAFALIENNGTDKGSVIISGKDAIVLEQAISNLPLKDGNNGKKIRHISLGNSQRKVEIACVKTNDSDGKPNNNLLCFIDLDSKF